MDLSSNTLLDIKDLNIVFHTSQGALPVVRNLSLQITKGETLAIVGESGCGKSVSAQSINRILPCPPGEISSGSIIFEDQDLLGLSEKEMLDFRGSKISMIFQEPMTSLNPVFRIGDQLADIFIQHENLRRKEAKLKSLELLDLVKIPAPEKRFKSYPHQLSGGMRQRVMIAMALASPFTSLLIADEPTTALDVTIQAQILALLADLKKQKSMSLLLITHDMGVVAETADKVAVMYAGRKVEEASVFKIFADQRHPYTQGLLSSLPNSDANLAAKRLSSIPGNVPNLFSIGTACPFINRCKFSKPICAKEFPEETRVDEEHSFWCHNPLKSID